MPKPIGESSQKPSIIEHEDGSVDISFESTQIISSRLSRGSISSTIDLKILLFQNLNH